MVEWISSIDSPNSIPFPLLSPLVTTNYPLTHSPTREYHTFTPQYPYSNFRCCQCNTSCAFLLSPWVTYCIFGSPALILLLDCFVFMHKSNYIANSIILHSFLLNYCDNSELLRLHDFSGVFRFFFFFYTVLGVIPSLIIGLRWTFRSIIRAFQPFQMYLEWLPRILGLHLHRRGLARRLLRLRRGILLAATAHNVAGG